MATITIEIPKEILKRANGRKLLVVDPKEFAKDLQRSWEMDDALKASRLGRREHRLGKTKILKNLSRLIK
ncbi:hypothetical protein A3G55_01910 [Candidatus Giovannonibacteria bacterium RIFCSPLOWO2_12_FULL_44_25]|uniref:Uncharacterized protein n=2 Tax=Candidatus Giovannoniibacteriota TaxID=1752738 RepID=A0A1F5W7L1_9BACT|nr:MAG: hypothetical protein UW15_C0024G0016 [Parcubacteria group bacterium GW2011_GWC1_44_10]KKT60201.1 MAG: hypothetical protein UW53_C0003G0112 [Candidatus Giovannonibacteria bacterium GW2011_GWA1_44_25]KKU30048.1 MAG: hypothetical protein UX43_C0003G0141 [Candidatus Giovannonibacteria bacterium GW2011_GWB1_46_20]OGF49405.1 MAG: hypothetical protein A2120_03745 [Candidatus Giovannonibacteria bacterium GWA2_45_15]OGF59865.1 MAG: hypothetical protein A2W40_02040 [Candidatus Giovannonibacteria 